MSHLKLAFASRFLFDCPLRFWISPSRKSFLQVFTILGVRAYRQVFRINPDLAVLCVCNHKDPRTLVTPVFEGQALVVRGMDNAVHWIKLSGG